MKYYNLMSITISQLVIFQAAATLNSFTKAAQKLSITQSSVSKSISSIETQLDVVLFERLKGHKLQLTEAGSFLYNYCSKLIPDLYQTFNALQIISNCGNCNLRIGANKNARNDDYLLPIIKRFARQNELQPQNIDLHVRLTYCAEMVHAVRDNKMDLAFICSREIHDNCMDGLQYQELIQTPMVAFINSSNPLFCRDSLQFKDLLEEPLILMQEGQKYSTQTQSLVNLMMQYGKLPNVGIYVNHTESIGFNLLLGKGIFIADEFFALPYNPEVKAFNLRDIEPSGLSLLYSRVMNRPIYDRFIDCAKDFFQNYYHCPYHVFG